MEPASKMGCWLGVALGVFVLLTATVLLMPVHEHHPQSAKAACLSNVKQQGLALLMYANDNNDALPRSTAWIYESMPYVKNEDIHHCPALRETDPDAYGYAMNSAMSGRKTAAFGDPAKEILIFESTMLGRNASSPLKHIPDPGRHRGYNSVCHLDGAAGFVLPAEMVAPTTPKPGKSPKKP